MDHQEKLERIINTLDSTNHIKSCLNYGELILVIETRFCFNFDYRKTFDSIIYDPATGADVLHRIKDLLVYLRDGKNEELKKMYSDESPITAPILYHFLNITLKIRQIILYFIEICKSYESNPSCIVYIYPYLCSLDDVVEVIAYRHLKLFLNNYKYSPIMKNYLPHIPEKVLSDFKRKGCERISIIHFKKS